MNERHLRAGVTMCDGSVQFLSENIAMTTYCALHGINEGIPIGQLE